MYLMTAEQAKTFMKIYKDDFVKGQLKFINYKIAEAVQEGKDYAIINNAVITSNFNKQVEMTLKNLGYNIKKDDDFIIVSWGE